jgi:hypothetical protein
MPLFKPAVRYEADTLDASGGSSAAMCSVVRETFRMQMLCFCCKVANHYDPL